MSLILYITKMFKVKMKIILKNKFFVLFFFLIRKWHGYVQYI